MLWTFIQLVCIPRNPAPGIKSTNRKDSTMSASNATTARDKERHASFKDVRDDVRELKNDVTDAVTGTARDGLDAARQGAETAIDRTVQSSRKATDSVLASHERLCDHIAKHPTSSILIAFGVGALMSRMIPRR
jgi:ElaB/YqjD/DUF883 family membrane-anchored ribosome-binding protein